MNDAREVLRAKLNLETAQLGWPELERHFARGAVVKLARGVDLVDAAVQIAENDTECVQAWLAKGTLAPAAMSDAEDWHARRPTFWAVVVAPWVLIQEC